MTDASLRQPPDFVSCIAQTPIHFAVFCARQVEGKAAKFKDDRPVVSTIAPGRTGFAREPTLFTAQIKRRMSRIHPRWRRIALVREIWTACAAKICSWG